MQWCAADTHWNIIAYLCIYDDVWWKMFFFLLPGSFFQLVLTIGNRTEQKSHSFPHVCRQGAHHHFSQAETKKKKIKPKWLLLFKRLCCSNKMNKRRSSYAPEMGGGQNIQRTSQCLHSPVTLLAITFNIKTRKICKFCRWRRLLFFLLQNKATIYRWSFSCTHKLYCLVCSLWCLY